MSIHFSHCFFYNNKNSKLLNKKKQYTMPLQKYYLWVSTDMTFPLLNSFNYCNLLQNIKVVLYLSFNHFFWQLNSETIIYQWLKKVTFSVQISDREKANYSSINPLKSLSRVGLEISHECHIINIGL